MRSSLIILMVLWCATAQAQEPITADMAVTCIIGEARGEYTKHGFNAFLAVAEVLRQNTTMYGCQAKISPSEANYMRNRGYYEAARQAWIESEHTNITNGATNFESTDFKTPYWAKDMKVVFELGKHRFYK